MRQFINLHELVGFRVSHLKFVWPVRHQQTGGLISCGPDTKDLWRRAGGYADKILKGSKPADLPVEQPTKFDLIVNPRPPRRLG